MNEIITQEKHELWSPEEVEKIRQYDEFTKRYKVWWDSKKEQYLQFLKDNGLDSYTQDGISLIAVKPYVKKQVDTKALKDEGLYDIYTKDVEVKGSLRIQVDYED